MKNWFARLRGRKEVALAHPERAPIAIPPLVLREGTTLPIVDWPALDAHAPHADDIKAVDAFWTAAAHRWLEAMRNALGDGYTIVESEHFLLLSALEARPNKVVLDYVEKTRRRILLLLEHIAYDTENGKVCILIFQGHRVLVWAIFVKKYRYLSMKTAVFEAT
jgi:hypothetical protein